MHRVVRVSTGNGYTLDVVFADGTSGKVDLSTRLFGPIFEPLKEPTFFSQVRIDEYGHVRDWLSLAAAGRSHSPRRTRR